MKQTFKSFIYGCIAIAGSIHYAQAQDLAFASNNVKNADAELLAIANHTVASAAIPATRVNNRVTRRFIKNYQNAENVQWYNNGNGYLAMFDWAGVKSHASFGKNGYWNYDVRFGTQKDLPAGAKWLIQSNYVEYTIGKATEVTVGNQKAWIVNVEDADNLVLVRIMDNQLDELAHYDTHAKTKRKARIIIPQ